LDDETCQHCRNFRRIDAFSADQYWEHVSRCEKFAFKAALADVFDFPERATEPKWRERVGTLLRRDSDN
jgi:hypothetical protein